MLKAEQVPKEVALRVCDDRMTLDEARFLVAAALNAWPGMEERTSGRHPHGIGGPGEVVTRRIILPITEKQKAEV